jgi:hypothetical protein
MEQQVDDQEHRDRDSQEPQEHIPHGNISAKNAEPWASSIQNVLRARSDRSEDDPAFFLLAGEPRLIIEG